MRNGIVLPSGRITNIPGVYPNGGKGAVIVPSVPPPPPITWDVWSPIPVSAYAAQSIVDHDGGLRFGIRVYGAPEGSTYVWEIVGTNLLAGSVSVAPDPPYVGLTTVPTQGLQSTEGGVSCDQIWVVPNTVFATVKCSVTHDGLTTVLTQGLQSTDDGSSRIYGSALVEPNNSPQSYAFPAPAGTIYQWSFSAAADGVMVVGDQSSNLIELDWSGSSALPGAPLGTLSMHAQFGDQIWDDSIDITLHAD